MSNSLFSSRSKVRQKNKWQNSGKKRRWLVGIGGNCGLFGVYCLYFCFIFHISIQNQMPLLWFSTRKDSLHKNEYFDGRNFSLFNTTNHSFNRFVFFSIFQWEAMKGCIIIFFKSILTTICSSYVIFNFDWKKIPLSFSYCFCFSRFGFASLIYGKLDI